MNDKEFDEIMQLVVSELAEERIPHQQHAFPPDFESRLIWQADEAGHSAREQNQERKDKPLLHTEKPAHSALRKKPEILPARMSIFGGMAAGILIALTVGAVCLHNDGEMIQSSEMPLEVMSSMPGDSAEPAGTAANSAEERAAHTLRTVTTAAETGVPQTTQTVPIAEAAAATPSDESEPQHTAPAETEPQQTAPAESAPQPPALVYEMGDVDMDGQITYVDAALVALDVAYHSGAAGEWEDYTPLTAEQLLLANVNGLDDGEYRYLTDESGTYPLSLDYKQYYAGTFDTESYPLSMQDVWIIRRVAEYRNWFGMDVTTGQYAADPDFYIVRADVSAMQEQEGAEWYFSWLNAQKAYERLAEAGHSYRFKEGLQQIVANGTVEDHLKPEPDPEYLELKTPLAQFAALAAEMLETYFRN